MIQRERAVKFDFHTVGHRNSGGEPSWADAQMRCAAGRGKPMATRSEADANGRSRIVSSSSCRRAAYPSNPSRPKKSSSVSPPTVIALRDNASGDAVTTRTAAPSVDGAGVALTMRQVVRGSRLPRCLWSLETTP